MCLFKQQQRFGGVSKMQVFGFKWQVFENYDVIVSMS